MNTYKYNNIIVNILYEDNHLLVVQKPEGVLSQKDSTNDCDMLTILKTYIKEKYNKPNDVYLGLVHRLDRRVSGVMVFCRTSKAASRISEDIRNKKFDKTYVAVCQGFFEGEGYLVNKLDKCDKEAIESKEGKESKLFYKVVNHFNIDNNVFTTVRIKLFTGKFNQIRKQMQIFGHPLINDFKYGYAGKNYDDSLGLKCVKLGFYHPITKDYLEFTALKQTNDNWTKYMEIDYE